MNELQHAGAEIVSNLIINGDLSKLSAPQKIEYYKGFCERLGLDPFTQPFKILSLNGKQVLYCDRSGAQQLNKKHGVSHEIKTREKVEELYIVTCRASLPDGRYTDSIGAVNIKGFAGDNLANAIMKCETKAKRRATLDLLGLGILDETETGTIPGAQVVDIPYDCDELKDEYLQLLSQLESITREVDAKMMPDNWKKEQNVENFLKAIAHVKQVIEEEKILRKGLDTPHTIEAQGEAIRSAIEKDDFYEQRKTK